MGEKRTQPAGDDKDLELVQDARRSVVVLTTLAYCAAAMGLGSLVVVLILWLFGAINFEQALAGAFSSSFFTILTAGTTYGAKSNLAINASRLERMIRDSAAGDSGGGQQRSAT